MNKNVPFKITVLTEYFYPESERKYDELEVKTNGCLQIKEDGYRLLYRDGGKENDIFSELTFKNGGDSLSVTKKGDVECKMIFSPERAHSFLYKLSGFSFDAEILTHRLSIDLNEEGGKIEILYKIVLGGQEQKISMRIFAEA